MRMTLLLLVTLTVLGAALLPTARPAAAAGVVPLGEQPHWFRGDANCDSRIDSLDAAIVLQFDAGLLDALRGDGDSNEDGEVNSIDAVLILQFDAGLMPDQKPNFCIIVPPPPGPF